jgi:hypothetical protein
LLDLSGKTKIGELHIAIFKKKHIFRFEVAISNVIFVELFQSQDYTGKDELHSNLACLGEAVEPLSSRFDEAVEIASLGPLHHDVVIMLISEDTVNICDEGMSECHHNVFLVMNVLQEAFLFDFAFVHSLDSIVLFLSSLGALLSFQFS